MEDKQSFKKTDSDLVLAAISGDRGAFAALVERHVGSVYKFSYRYVRNGPDAEDVSQEAFLRVWNNLKKFDRSKNFKTWLFAITKNASLDLLKKKKTLPFSALGEDEDAVHAVLAPYVAVSDGSDAVFDRGVLKEDLEALLSRLPQSYRDILVLRYTDNLRFREIAERLHEPIDTVKSRHRRGLALLRDLADRKRLSGKLSENPS